MHDPLKMVVIGQLTLDDVVLFDQAALLDSPGGAGLYALAGTYLWDTAPVGFVTRMGDDYDLTDLIDKTKNSIDYAGINKVDAPSIHIWNMFDRKGHRYFIKQRWGSDDDLMGILPEYIPERFWDCQNFLVAAFPLDWQAKVIKAMPVEKMVLVDPHFQGIFPKYHELWDDLFPHIDVFLPSEEELLRYFTIEALSDVRGYVPYLKRLTEKGPSVVGVKVGSQGCVVVDRDKKAAFHIPAYLKDNVVDVTGCGDVFCGGFLSSYVDDGDIYEAGLHGVVGASFNLEDYGVLHNFSIDRGRVQQRLEQFRNSLDREKQRVQYE